MTKKTNIDLIKDNKFQAPTNMFAHSRTHPLWSRANNYGAVGKKYTNTEISKMLLDPYVSYKELQKMSNYFWANSPFYQNIAYYLGTLLSFNGVLYPDGGLNVNQTTMKNRLISSALIMKKLNMRHNMAHIFTRTILNGETFWYDMSEEKNETYLIQEIPSQYCQLAYVHDDSGMWRYYVNLGLLNNQYNYELPPEIAMAYERYMGFSEKKKKETSDDNYLGINIPNYLYPVSDKGFAVFVHKNKALHDYPFLSSMFTDLNALEDNKDYIDEYLKESNIKLLHLKIPTDKETGIPLMDAEVINEFHESAKAHMPKSTAPLTNPFDVEALNFDKVQGSAMDVVNNSKAMAQFSSGVSSSLFDANTTNGLGYSIDVDASKMYPLLSFIENVCNYKLKKYKFRTSLLHIHQHNKDDIHQQYASDLLNGGHRSLWLATNGIDLYDSLMLSELEKALDFDSMLPAKINASQMNSVDVDKKNGRPNMDDDDKSDSSVVGGEYT